jgi:hypothetical protein
VVGLLLLPLFQFSLRQFANPSNLLRSPESTSADASPEADIIPATASGILQRCLCSFVLSSFVFVLILPMLRIGEMHMFVIAINYVHLVLSMFMMTVVFYVPLDLRANFKKMKIE